MDNPEEARSPLDDLSWPVRTQRLSIRPAIADDDVATWPYRRLASVAEWVTSAPSSFDAYQTVFRRPERLAKTLVIEKDGVIIGDLMLATEDAWAQSEIADSARRVQAELGWVIHPDHAGHGYATEAVRALLHICFEGLKLRRVTANCFADNVASWRLMERVGMRRELYAVRDSLHRSGNWLDGVGYALLADEWERD